MFVKINLKTLLYSSLCIVSLICISCDSDDPFEIENAKTLDFNSFTLQVPQDWESFPLQGIDTYIGGLTNKIDTLYFDFGYLSFASIDAIQPSDETISFQTLKIGGVDAKIVKVKRAEEAEARYSLYVDKRDKMYLNRIYGYGLSDERLVTAIFLSHRFID